MLDFQKKEDYLVKKMEYINYAGSGFIPLQTTEVTLLDSVYDPFGAPTDHYSLLNVETFREIEIGKDKDGETFYIFMISDKARFQQRIRYGVWQALGDIGGFYDGVGLLFGSIISQCAAT